MGCLPVISNGLSIDYKKKKKKKKSKKKKSKNKKKKEKKKERNKRPYIFLDLGKVVNSLIEGICDHL